MDYFNSFDDDSLSLLFRRQGSSLSDVSGSEEQVAINMSGAVKKFDELVGKKVEKRIVVPKSDALDEDGAKMLLMEYLANKNVEEGDMPDALQALLLTFGTVGGSEKTNIDDIQYGEGKRLYVVDFYSNPALRKMHGRVWTPAQIIRGVSRQVVEVCRRHGIAENEMVLNVIDDKYLSAEALAAKLSSPVTSRPYSGVPSSSSSKRMAVKYTDPEGYEEF